MASLVSQDGQTTVRTDNKREIVRLKSAGYVEVKAPAKRSASSSSSDAAKAKPSDKSAE